MARVVIFEDLRSAEWVNRTDLNLEKKGTPHGVDPGSVFFYLKMVGRTGIEPVTRGLRVRCSTN